MGRLIGTAGHVDHGKTTLIGALTGIDTDRLPEEKKRGLTIDIGFAYVDLPEVGRVSIVDVPGHERFIANMLVGALGIDVALLCVAADESVMPQTREHFQILELLPVDQMVVALTRADAADEETREIAAMEVRELLAMTRFESAEIVPVSAHTGEGMERLRSALSHAMRQPSAAREGPWYLPVDRVFTIRGHGAVVTGTLMQGHVHSGETAVVQPIGREVRVRQIQGHDEATEESEFGRRTALNLAGVKTEELHRGMTVGAVGHVLATTVLDARVRWSSEPKHGSRVRVSIGADEAMAKLFLNAHDPGLAQLRFDRPVAAVLGQPLIVRRNSPPDILAGGRVTVPQAKPRRRGEDPGRVAPGPSGSQEDGVRSLVAAALDGIPTEEVCRLAGATPQALGETFERLRQKGEVMGFAGWWFTEETFGTASARLREALRSAHVKQPTRALLPREPVVQAARLPWAGKALDRILAHLAATGEIRVNGTQIALAEFRPELPTRQRELLDRVKGALAEAGLSVPGPAALALALNLPRPAVEEILQVGQDAGEVVRLEEGIFYGVEQLAAARAAANAAFGDRTFTASEFREAMGTSRKYAIPLLEFWDGQRVTFRQGDHRRFA